MTVRTLLTALLLSTVAVGSAVAVEPSASPAVRNGGSTAVGVIAEVASGPVVPGFAGWLRGRPLLRGFLLAGAAAVGLVLARAGYRRARARYRAHTSPTIVLLDDDLEEFEWGDADAEAGLESEAPETDDRET